MIKFGKAFKTTKRSYLTTTQCTTTKINIKSTQHRLFSSESTEKKINEAEANQKDDFVESIRKRIESVYQEYHNRHGELLETDDKMHEKIEDEMFKKSTDIRNKEIIKRLDKLKGRLVTEKRN